MPRHRKTNTPPAPRPSNSSKASSGLAAVDEGQSTAGEMFCPGFHSKGPKIPSITGVSFEDMGCAVGRDAREPNAAHLCGVSQNLLVDRTCSPQALPGYRLNPSMSCHVAREVFLPFPPPYIMHPAVPIKERKHALDPSA